MPDLKIRREHTLGLAPARRIARDWVAAATEQFGMDCTYREDEAGDQATFARSGVSGALRVTATAFELDAKLGFLLGAYQARIEQEINRNLDELMARHGQGG